MPSERYQRYHEAKARGGLALTMFGGSSNVSPEVRVEPAADQPVRRARRRAFPAVLAANPRPRRRPDVPGQPCRWARRALYRVLSLAPIGPSPARETLHRAFAKEMDEHDIARVVADFAEADGAVQRRRASTASRPSPART